jgi:hypothetical protein
MDSLPKCSPCNMHPPSSISSGRRDGELSAASTGRRGGELACRGGAHSPRGTSPAAGAGCDSGGGAAMVSQLGLYCVQVAEYVGFLLVTRRRCLLLPIVPWRPKDRNRLVEKGWTNSTKKQEQNEQRSKSPCSNRDEFMSPTTTSSSAPCVWPIVCIICLLVILVVRRTADEITYTRETFV